MEDPMVEGVFFDNVEIESGSTMLIDEGDVVDSLWGITKARRQVRVSNLF